MFKIKKALIILLSFVFIFVLCAFPVSAVSVYKCDFNQPVVNEFSGYIESISNDNNVVISFFSITVKYNQNAVYENTVYPKVSLYKLNKETLGLRVSLDGTHSYVVTTGQMYTSNSGRYNLVTTTSSGSDDVKVDYFSYNSGGLKAIRVYGPIDVSHVTSYMSYTGDWVVTYGSDTAIYQKLEEIRSAYSGISSSINSNADKNASETQANDDKNTQAIIDNQNDLAEKEKTETQNQGEGSVNDVSGAIEDKSVGFINSIGNLVSAMSYNGTACAWKMPSIQLPAISGIMDEVKLTDEMPIDFEYWVNKIPSNILLLVRSVLTIALIVYCFKELYSTISYVLTLKGGGKDE